MKTLFSLLIALSISLPIGTMTYQSQKRDVQEQDINFHKYMEKTDNETLALGVESTNDFEPGYYEFEPYPGAIEKYIEATAYCYGQAVGSVVCKNEKVCSCL